MNVLLVDNLIMPEEGSLAFLDVHPHLGLQKLETPVFHDLVREGLIIASAVDTGRIKQSRETMRLDAFEA